MKLKSLAKQIETIFRLSEDFDSDDSDIDDDMKWLVDRKKILKKLKVVEHKNLAVEGKLLKYSK